MEGQNLDDDEQDPKRNGNSLTNRLQSTEIF